MRLLGLGYDDAYLWVLFSLYRPSGWLRWKIPISLSLSLSLPPSHSLERYRVNNNLAAELSKTYTQGWLWWDFELLIISRAAIIIFIFAPDGKNRIPELFICLESVAGGPHCVEIVYNLCWLWSEVSLATDPVGWYSNSHSSHHSALTELKVSPWFHLQWEWAQLNPPSQVW